VKILCEPKRRASSRRAHSRVFHRTLRSTN